MGATYLYGIASVDHLPDLTDVELPEGATSVRGLAVDGLSAVVSEYSGPNPSDLPKDALLQLLLAHQRVLEAVSGAFPLLPAKLGTVLPSEDAVRDLLSRYRGRLDTALDDVGNAVEVDLSATWDIPRVLTEIGTMTDLADAVAGITVLVPEETIAERLQIGKIVQERVDQRRQEYRRRVVGELTRLVRDAQPNPRPTDEVVFNVAFLVERDDLSAFDDAVDRLGEEFEGRLDMRYVGPLPPYSFGTVEITRFDPIRISAARDVLGLGETATRDEIQRAYRQRAAQLHPDANRSDPLAEENFAALAAAYKEIDAYVRACGDSPDGLDDDGRCSLSEKDVGHTLFLEVKREGLHQWPATGVEG